ncbi:hypothetical protein ACH42_04775 [Endozoicomonas sp. (ex Bugula neritina AB1)]|nr:hypothetical protein ACH42_04775 [Endozoicomonas sp. (ex Bugula neritina AB1)]
MFKRSFLMLALSVSGFCMASSETQKATVSVNDADSTLLTIYPDNTLVRQQFTVSSSDDGIIKIKGMPSDWLEDSLEVDYRDKTISQLPEKLWWYRGGLDRDMLYRKLVGKGVELVGGGLNASVQGTMLTYDKGMALVQGSNGRQYLVDLQESQGFQIAARETVFIEQDYKPVLNAEFISKTVSGKLRLAYSTPSIRYNSHYRLTLEQKDKARLELKALLSNNTDTDYSNARVRLVSGDSGSVSDYGRKGMMLDATAGKVQSHYGERIGEVLVTTLPDTTTLPAHSSQQISLYSENYLSLEKLYALDIYGRSYGGRGQALERPRLTYRFKVTGDLPAGQVRMFQEGPDGSLVVSGSSWMSQTTSGDMARLTMGEALAVRIERVRIDSQKNANNELSVQWQVTVYNDQSDEITVLLSDLDRNLLKIDNVRNAELDSSSALRVSVPAGKKRIINYSSRYSR